MFIYEFLEESPQLVGLIDQSVKSRVVSEEILHLSDGGRGLQVIVLESQEFLLLRISRNDEAILAIRQLQEVFTDVREVIRIQTEFVDYFLYLFPNGSFDFLLPLSIFVQC